MWSLPGPGIEPMTPALAGGFLTTGPPEKSLTDAFDSLMLLTFPLFSLLLGPFFPSHLLRLQGSNLQTLVSVPFSIVLR